MHFVGRLDTVVVGFPRRSAAAKVEIDAFEAVAREFLVGEGIGVGRRVGGDNDGTGVAARGQNHIAVAFGGLFAGRGHGSALLERDRRGCGHRSRPGQGEGTFIFDRDAGQVQRGLSGYGMGTGIRPESDRAYGLSGILGGVDPEVDDGAQVEEMDNALGTAVGGLHLEGNARHGHGGKGAALLDGGNADLGGGEFRAGGVGIAGIDVRPSRKGCPGGEDDGLRPGGHVYVRGGAGGGAGENAHAVSTLPEYATVFQDRAGGGFGLVLRVPGLGVRGDDLMVGGRSGLCDGKTILDGVAFRKGLRLLLRTGEKSRPRGQRGKEQGKDRFLLHRPSNYQCIRYKYACFSGIIQFHNPRKEYECHFLPFVAGKPGFGPEMWRRKAYEGAAMPFAARK